MFGYLNCHAIGFWLVGHGHGEMEQRLNLGISLIFISTPRNKWRISSEITKSVLRTEGGKNEFGCATATAFLSRNCVSRGANGESSGLEWRLFSNSRHKIINLIFRFEPSRCLCMRFSSLVPTVPFRPDGLRANNKTTWLVLSFVFVWSTTTACSFPLSKSNSSLLAWRLSVR